MKKTSSIIVGIIIVSFAVWFFLLKQDTVKVDVPNIETSQTQEKLIIAFGDSLTAGYRLPLFESYPAQLEQKLKDAGFSVTVVNAGISGETTRGNLERAQFIRDQNPNVVLLGIGGNDALRSLPIEETRKNIKETMSILLSGANPPKVLLLKMQAPINSGLGYKQAFDSLYKDIAKEYDVELIPFIVMEVFLNTKYMLDDGIHPNKEGYALLVEKYILEEVVRALR
ncbi:MAG: acyl-CoA thioesterase [Patescibacteria group bacterium]|nr:acyl-CoA thioesterase [Patescibacteria group bacterium]